MPLSLLMFCMTYNKSSSGQLVQISTLINTHRPIILLLYSHRSVTELAKQTSVTN